MYSRAEVFRTLSSTFCPADETLFQPFGRNVWLKCVLVSFTSIWCRQNPNLQILSKFSLVPLHIWHRVSLGRKVRVLLSHVLSKQRIKKVYLFFFSISSSLILSTGIRGKSEIYGLFWTSLRVNILALLDLREESHWCQIGVVPRCPIFFYIGMLCWID